MSLTDWLFGSDEDEDEEMEPCNHKLVAEDREWASVSDAYFHEELERIVVARMRKYTGVFCAKCGADFPDIYDEGDRCFVDAFGNTIDCDDFDLGEQTSESVGMKLKEESGVGFTRVEGEEVYAPLDDEES